MPTRETHLNSLMSCGDVDGRNGLLRLRKLLGLPRIAPETGPEATIGLSVLSG